MYSFLFQGSEVNPFATKRTFPSQSPSDLLMLLWASLLVIAPVCGRSDELILQTPSPVFEGDLLVLRCLEKEGAKLTEVTFYKNGIVLPRLEKDSDFSILRVTLSDSGQYHCRAKKSSYFFLTTEIEAQRVTIQVQELFSLPVLRRIPFQPSEGNPMTLSCETHLPPEKAHTQLHFYFFRDGRIISSGQERTPKLQLAEVWKEDSGSYLCEAKAVTSRVSKSSHPVRIEVRRIPVSGIHMEIQPPGGQVTEGQRLVLLCSVAGGTGNITFSWHKEGTETVLKKKTQRLLMAKLEILAVRESEAGKYYCAADNTNSPLHSRPVSISVKIPVSPPLLTFSVPETQMFVGKVVELRCDAQRGSAPILYQFYHKAKIMKNSSAPFGGAASFNLSLTEQHAGNYFCKADNGITVQFSKVLTLSVKVPTRKQKGLLAGGVSLGLLGFLGLIGVVLLSYFRTQRKSGQSFALGPSRNPAIPRFQEHTQVELDPTYVNELGQQSRTHSPVFADPLLTVNPVISDVVYSEGWRLQQKQEDAALGKALDTQKILNKCLLTN
ncbi:Fc receptor-like protein 2 isoform X2 [Trichosurus vulpecula]|uniref:Fc receptor-like protein 2 isoform X2 n=1 Tax=Trichosurus vulpecula TaxID=9337 RepID=UPI00186B1F22|nr:Fc receptor-like protein 2 isoform X2 [Trichosurus vulpecula]